MDVTAAARVSELARSRRLTNLRTAYSYRNDSIGSSRDARIAGSSPLTRPTTIRIPVQIDEQLGRQHQVDVELRVSCRRAARRGTAAG